MKAEKRASAALAKTGRKASAALVKTGKKASSAGQNSVHRLEERGVGDLGLLELLKRHAYEIQSKLTFHMNFES